MSEPTLTSLLDLAWTRIIRGVHDKRSPARHLTIATVAPDGRPELRTVVLRAAERSAATLEMHTDTASPKVTALRANPRAEIHVWDAGQHLQMRLSGRVEVLTGAKVADRWARIPRAARQSYGSCPPPGAQIDGPFKYDTPGDPDRFAALVCYLNRIDLLRLDTPHHRAVYQAEDGWAGHWVAP